MLPRARCSVRGRARRRWGRTALAVAGLVLTAMLAACSVGGGDSVTCPRAAIMPDLQAVVRFKPGPGRADSDAAYGARLMAIPMNCRLETKSKSKDQSIDIAGKLAIKAQRTDTRTTSAQVTYFVAIVNRANTILNKRDFVLDLKFDGEKRTIEITDELHFVIPLVAGTSGADYAVLLGFQVTPQELEYNRAHLVLPGSTPTRPGSTPTVPGSAPTIPGSTPSIPGSPPGSAPFPGSPPTFPGSVPG